MKKTVLGLLFLLVLFASISPAEEVKKGRISGMMMIKDGGLMSDGAVFIYDDAKGALPLPDKYFRVPDNVVFIDNDGKFSVEIAPGTYYIGGLKKKTGKEGVTMIEGTILNGQGGPVEGVVVFADVTPAMNGEVSFVSNWTGKDGKYFLRVHEGGKYNLNASDFTGGGIYGRETTEPVTVKTGEVLHGIDMKAVK